MKCEHKVSEQIKSGVASGGDHPPVLPLSGWTGLFQMLTMRMMMMLVKQI